MHASSNVNILGPFSFVSLSLSFENYKCMFRVINILRILVYCVNYVQSIENTEYHDDFTWLFADCSEKLRNTKFADYPKKT